MLGFRLLILSLVLLVQQASSQNAILEGIIIDQNEPIPYANIYINDLDLGTYSDSTGYFIIKEIPSGEYKVNVSFLGYRTEIKKINFPPNSKISLDIKLSPLPDLLDEVVITGTMKPTYVSASPVKVDVISVKTLEKFIPSSSGSIVENIQLVNGVQEVVACGVCYTNSISINGLPGPYTAILMDGTPMYGNLASVYGLNGIPNMIIDRFEVIKGPSSTLYGSEAVAGVINIITKDPEDQPLFSIDIMGMNKLESFGNITVAPKVGKLKGFIGLNYAYINHFEDENDDFFGDEINLDRYSVFTKWKLDRKSGKQFNIAAKYYYEDRRNGVEEFLEKRNYRRLRGSDQVYGESILTNRAELFGTYELNSVHDLKLDFSFSHHDQNSYYGSDFYEANQQIGFANLLCNKTLKNHDLIIGLTSRINIYDDNTVATEILENGKVLNTPDRQFIPGLFIQDEFPVTKRATLLGGLRLDHYGTHGFILSPRINMKYQFSDWTTFRTNFGTGFRIVNLFTEDHAFITGQREVIIEEALKPERSYNVSLNFNHVYAALGGSGTVDIESYYTYFINKILPDFDTPGKIIYANSEGNAQTRGIGINVNHSFYFPLAFNIGLNIQSVTETERDENGEWNKRTIEYAPKWSGIGSMNYTWKKQKTTFAITSRITGPMALPEVYDFDSEGNILSYSRPTESKPFALHNFQVTKEFTPRFSAYFGVQNINNFTQAFSPLVGYNDPNANIGFSSNFDTSYAYGPSFGREFYLGIKWDIK